MSSASPLVLIIEDDSQIRRFLRALLGAEGYRFCESETGGAGIAEAAARQADLILLDLGLPDMDGHEVIRAVRAFSQIPIVVLSARGQESDKVTALDLGADDYVEKPFAAAELMARVRAALRRSAGGQVSSGATFRFGDVEVDTTRRVVTVGGSEVHLTPNEYRLLGVMLRHAGRVLTQRHLLNEVWGPNSLDQSHYLRVYVAQLRRKLEPDPARPRFFHTEPGVGYRLVIDR